MKNSKTMGATRRRKTGLSADQMLVFGAVARAGGIRGAAAALGVPKSTISRRVAELEASIGAQLVRRSARRFELTELGELLAGRAQALEELVHASEEALASERDEPRGTLRFATSPLLGEELLPEMFAEYLLRCPKVSLQVQLSADYVDLQKHRVDVAVRTGPLADSSELFATRLATSITGLYASKKYLRTHGTPARPEELSQHECLLVGSAAKGSWWFQGKDDVIKVSVSSRLTIDNFRAVRSAAAAGFGILRTARFFGAPLVESGELVPLLEPFWPKVTLYAVHRAGPKPPAKIRIFVDLLKQTLSRQQL